jgi:hypothetical protein
MTILKAATFEATSTEVLPWDADTTREVGTIEANLAGRTQLVKAVRYDNGRIVSWDFTGRYRTGTKAWPATVSLDADGRESVWYGKDHHTGRCQKTGLSFA